MKVDTGTFSNLIWSRNLANNPHIVFIYSSARHRLLRHHLVLTGHAGVDDFWFMRRIVASRICQVPLPPLHSDDCPFAQGTNTAASGSLAPATSTVLVQPRSVRKRARLVLALDYCIYSASLLSATTVAPAAFTTHALPTILLTSMMPNQACASTSLQLATTDGSIALSDHSQPVLRHWGIRPARPPALLLLLLR